MLDCSIVEFDNWGIVRKMQRVARCDQHAGKNSDIERKDRGMSFNSRTSVEDLEHVVGVLRVMAVANLSRNNPKQQESINHIIQMTNCALKQQIDMETVPKATRKGQ